MSSISALDESRSVSGDAPVATGGLPGIGHLGALLVNPVKFMEGLIRQGEVVKIYLGRRPVYVLNSLDLVRSLLVAKVDNYPRGVIFEKAKKVLGNSLTVAEGEFHWKQRKLIQPSLHPSRVDHYMDVMIGLADRSIGHWRDGRTIDVNTEMHHLGMEMFVSALFGAAMDSGAKADVTRATPNFMAGIVAHSLYPAEWMEQLPIPVNYRFKAARHQMERVVDQIVSTYRAIQSPDEIGPTILGMLVSAKDQDSGQMMSADQLRDEVINLLVAGAEAPGTTLAWLFYELGKNGAVEKRVRDEIENELGDKPIRSEGLKNLVFTRAVIKETLRLHTPTWMLTYRAQNDDEMGGFSIPAGAEIAFSLTALHRHSGEFGDPEIFDPTRWLDGRTANLPKSAYMPFASGKHMCLGEHFSMQVMLIAVATIARRWRLVPRNRKVREVAVALVQPSKLTMELAARR